MMSFLDTQCASDRIRCEDVGLLDCLVNLGREKHGIDGGFARSGVLGSKYTTEVGQVGGDTCARCLACRLRLAADRWLWESVPKTRDVPLEVKIIVCRPSVTESLDCSVKLQGPFNLRGIFQDKAFFSQLEFKQMIYREFRAKTGLNLH